MAEDTNAGKIKVEVVAEIESYLQQLRLAANETEKTEKKTISSFKKMKTAFVGISAAAATFGASAIKSAYDYGNAIMDMRDKTGLASEQVSKLFALGTKGGLGNNEMVDIFSKFARSADQAARTTAQAEKNGLTTITAYDRLGITLTKANGEIKSMDELFMEAAISLQGFADGASKTALEMELFGRSGGKIHDTLHLTQEEMKQTIEQARRLGLVLTNDQAEGWKKVQIAGNDFNLTVKGLTVQIGNTLLPAFERLINKAQNASKWLSELNDKEREQISLVVELSAKFLAAAAAGKVLASTFSLMGKKATAMLGPIGLAITAVWALVEAREALNSSEASEKYGTIVKGQDEDVEVRKKAEWDGDGNTKYTYYVKRDPTITDTSNPNDFGDHINLNNYTPASDGELKKILALEDLEKKKLFDKKPAPNINDAVYSTGGGSDTQKTALQEYVEKMNKVISTSQKWQQLGQITREELASTITEQLAGLDKIAVSQDEELDKLNAQLDSRIQLKDIIRQTWDENARLASEASNLSSQQVQLAGTDENAKKAALQVQLETLQKNYDLLNSTVVTQDMYNQKQSTLNSILIEQQRIYSELNADELDNYKFALSLLQKKTDNNIKYLQFLEDEKNRLAELIILREQELKTITDPEKAKALEKELNLIKAQANAVADSTKSTQRSILMESKNVTAEMVRNWMSGMGEIMQGTKTAVDYANDLFNSLLDTLFKMATNSLINSIFNSGNNKTPTLSKEPGSMPPLPKKPIPRASGGHVMANTPYIVGEVGKELLYPRVDGYIKTASQTKDILNSDMPNVQINIINNTNSEVESKQQASFDGESYVVGIVLKNVRNSQDFRDTLKGAMS